MRIEDIVIDKEFAARLPTPSKAQFATLVEDVKSRGLVVPLVVTKQGLLLDGHRRLAAAKELGLKEVPTRTIDIDGDMSWGKAFAIAMNLNRRHMNEAQRADLLSSLLRVERVKAKERQVAAGAAGKKGGAGKKKPLASVEAKGSRESGKSAARVAAGHNLSTATVERVERVKRADPEVAKRMLEGELSVAGAAKKVKAQELQAKGKAETPEKPGVLARLEAGVGQFRTVYADPPWQYGDEGAPGGGVAGHYKTMSVEQLEKLNVGTLGHPEGSHLWMWTTWPMTRERVPHRVLEAWGYRWVGEIVWVKPGLGVGRWMRPATEILILGVKGDPPLPLLRDDHKALLEAPKGRHSVKPDEAYEVIERLSPGPYVELFARRERQSWMRWGNEA